MSSSQTSPATSSETPACDLPPEIWRRILSYLPPVDAQKMMGVDRKLFYLVLSEKYSEIQFDGDDEKTSRTLEQVNCLNIAALVKTLHLNPAFLSAGADTTPGPLTEGDDAPLPSSFSWIPKQLGCLFCCNRTNKFPPKYHDPDPSKTPGKRIFNAASSAFPKCSNLREISITVSDTCPFTPAFHTLLRSLPQQRGNDIEKVAVCTTLAIIPEVLESISKLSGLKRLDITTEESRASLHSDGTIFAADAIVKTINDVSATLTHLKISSAATEDDHTNLAPLFHRLGVLPNLRAFDVILGTQTLASDGGEGLTAFLNANKSHLEYLVLKPSLQPGETPPGFNHPKLREWLTEGFTPEFPELHTLEIDLSQQAKNPMQTLRYFPELKPIMPHLSSLTLSHASLSLTDLGIVLGMATGTQLKSLHCTVKRFSPQMLDDLATKAPHLTWLDLTYEERETRGPSPQVATREMNQVGGEMGDDLYDILAKQSHPNWPLSRLRIAYKKAQCRGVHPDGKLARAVENTVTPRKVDLDLAYHGCFCGESESSHAGSLAGQ